MSKTTKATTALAKIDEVPEVLSILDQEIGKLKTISESVYKTTGNLEGFSDIKAETKVENLIRAYSSVKGRENAYYEAAKDLKVATFPVFTVSGGTAADWKQDIMLRIDIITHKDKLDKLNEYKEKMSKFLSAEDQKAMLLKEMTDFFKGNK
ncbi:MAG: hypothetical protein E6R13_08250 [Spirochaetes bacterium]|nr:MAG: hypothetical protein E6R13_08250 [Spirochaetota bacterium]